MIVNIKTWILNKLVKPAIPVLKQIVYVLDIVAAKINSSLTALETLGISIDGTVLTNIKNVLSAITVVRAAVIKVVEFLGETFDSAPFTAESLALVDLDTELEKLKKLI
jgi:hypothetical protein